MHAFAFILPHMTDIVMNHFKCIDEARFSKWERIYHELGSQGAEEAKQLEEIAAQKKIVQGDDDDKSEGSGASYPWRKSLESLEDFWGYLFGRRGTFEYCMEQAKKRADTEAELEREESKKVARWISGAA